MLKISIQDFETIKVILAWSRQENSGILATVLRNSEAKFGLRAEYRDTSRYEIDEIIKSGQHVYGIDLLKVANSDSNVLDASEYMTDEVVDIYNKHTDVGTNNKHLLPLTLCKLVMKGDGYRFDTGYGIGITASWNYMSTSDSLDEILENLRGLSENNKDIVITKCGKDGATIVLSRVEEYTVVSRDGHDVLDCKASLEKATSRELIGGAQEANIAQSVIVLQELSRYKTGECLTNSGTTMVYSLMKAGRFTRCNELIEMLTLCMQDDPYSCREAANILDGHTEDVRESIDYGSVILSDGEFPEFMVLNVDNGNSTDGTAMLLRLTDMRVLGVLPLAGRTLSENNSDISKSFESVCIKSSNGVYTDKRRYIEQVVDKFMRSLPSMAKPKYTILRSMRDKIVAKMESLAKELIEENPYKNREFAGVMLLGYSLEEHSIEITIIVREDGIVDARIYFVKLK